MHLVNVRLRPQDYPRKDVYPFNLSIFQQTESLNFMQPVTFFIGENGTGKSTLLRAMCQKCGIHIWEDTERGRFKNNPFENDLEKYLDLEWASGSVPGAYFSSQTFQDFARALDEWAIATPGILDYFGGDSLLTRSHGESMITYFQARYKIKGIYFLDEPETALSPRSQLKLLKVLKALSETGQAQFIIASHSPLLLAYPDTTIYNFNTVPVQPIKYEETEYFQIYRDFLNNRGKYLRGI